MNEQESQPAGRSVDPFPTFAALRAGHSELLELDPETEGDEKYLRSVEEFFERARTTGALLSVDEERRASQSILNYWLTVLYRGDHKLTDTTLVELNPELKPRIQDERCPYPGVREFDETEGKYFFGRQRTIDYLLARLKEENFLALVGPSGSGKSSLVRAGLLPAIKNIGLASEEDTGVVQRYFFPLLTPGSNPAMNLASMLSKAVDEPGITTQHHYQKIRQGSKHLSNFLTEKIGRPSVIVVDQYEELFTLCNDREARRAFINNLLELQNSKHRIILCTNSEEFGGDLKQLPNFEKILERGTAKLPRLGTSELSDAISKPADLVGFKFKDQTVKDIVQEIGTLPIALPLLQFTLVKLWERRGTHDEYFAEMGGCRFILTASAEDFLRNLEPGERNIAEQLFRRMVSFDYKYRASILPVQLEARDVPVRLQEFAREVGSPAQVDAVVKRLAGAQLIRRSTSATPEDAQVELVHESLIQNWPRMAQWVAQQKRSRFKLASLSAAALVILIGSLFFLAGLWSIQLWEKYQSHEQASKWARASRKNLNDRRLDTAMLLSLAAYQIDPAGDAGIPDRYLFRGETDLLARGALLSTLLFHPRPTAFFGESQQSIGDIAFSPDGRWLAANDSDGKIEIWDWRERKIVKTLQDRPSQGPDIVPLIFSNDGSWLISGGGERKDDKVLGVVTLWGMSEATPGQRLSAPEFGRIVALALSRDNQKLAGLDEDSRVVIWDTKSGDVLPLLPLEHVTTLAFSNIGEIIAAGDEMGNVALWDVKRRRVLRTLQTCACLKQQAKTQNSIISIAFSPDDQTLAVSGTEETMLWPASSDEEPTRLATSHGGVGMILSFSEDGNTLAGFEGDKQVYLWDMTTPTVERIGENLFRPVTRSLSVAFSRDAKILASRGEQGITLWDLSGQPFIGGHKEDINDLAFSSDGSVASGSNDGTVHLRDANGRKLIELVKREESRSAVDSLAFSHNGKRLAAGFQNGEIKLWRLDDKENISDVTLGSGREFPFRVLTLAFSANSEQLISLATDAEGRAVLETWSVTEEKRIDNPGIPLEGGKSVTAVALSPYGSYLALATDKKDVLIWEVNQNRMIHVLPWQVIKTYMSEQGNLKNLATTIQSLEFSANGRWLVFGGDDSDSFFRCDLDEKERYVLDKNKVEAISLEGLSGDISDLALSIDEKTLAVAVNPSLRRGSSEDEPGVVVLVDTKKFQLMGDALRGHIKRTSALSFSEKGTLATGGEDGMVLLWDVNICEAQKKICSVVNRNFTEDEIKQHSIKVSNPNACKIEPVVRKECEGTR